MIKLTTGEKLGIAIAGLVSGVAAGTIANKVLNSPDEASCHEDGCLRLVQPDERQPYPLKTFLNKPAHDLTIGDTFLMQLGNVSIAILVPMAITGLSIMLQSQNSQEKHGL
jgi:hypothetical protein